MSIDVSNCCLFKICNHKIISIIVSISLTQFHDFLLDVYCLSIKRVTQRSKECHFQDWEFLRSKPQRPRFQDPTSLENSYKLVKLSLRKYQYLVSKIFPLILAQSWPCYSQMDDEKKFLDFKINVSVSNV